MSKRTKVVALDASLKKMFRTLEGRPMPTTLGSVVAQLDAQAAPQFRKAG